LACGEKCYAFFILAASLADPEVFICNEYILPQDVGVRDFSLTRAHLLEKTVVNRSPTE
jgi:hypothetical protein